MFNNVEINKLYDIRKEDENVILFSGSSRNLHFVDKQAFTILEMAFSKSFEEIVSDLECDTEEISTLRAFFLDLANKGIIRLTL